MSQTPRCDLPPIIVDDAPKKTTVRGVTSMSNDNGEQDKAMHAAKEQFRAKFAHSTKSQIRALISILSELNQANYRYSVYLLQLKPDSRLSFEVNDRQRGVKLTFDVDKKKVDLGMLTFEKGLTNLYYYYRYRGTKKNTRTGYKPEDNMADLQALKNYHRHIWIPKEGALHRWIMTEQFPDVVRQTINKAIPALTEDNGALFQFKEGRAIIHFLESTLRCLLYIRFESQPELKIPTPKGKDVPREAKQARFRTTPAIQQLYQGQATHIVEWSEGREKYQSNVAYNTDARYTVGLGLASKIEFRKRHGQMVYHSFDMNVINMTDFMSISSLTCISSKHIDMLYERYKNFMIQTKGTIQQGEDVSQRYVDKKTFRGDDQFRENLITLQNFIGNYYERMKSQREANAPATIRKTNRVFMESLLYRDSSQEQVFSQSEF